MITTLAEAIDAIQWYSDVMVRYKNRQPTAAMPEATAGFEAAVEFLENQEAEFWVHGSRARDLEQVKEYLTGDAHDQSKVQVLVDGHFWNCAADV